MLPPVMAVNGPPDGELEPEVSLSPDPPYPQLLGKAPLLSPDPSTCLPDPGPASPGKKRVRISDSTPSVRVIEDPPPPPRPAPAASRPVSQHRSYYQQFNSDYIQKLKAETSSPQLWRLPHSPASLHGDGVVRRKGEDVLPGDYGKECQAREYVGDEGEEEYRRDASGVVVQDYRESLTQDGRQGTCAEDVSSSSVVESLESRDNPFLPGGDLSKEAEDLLSKATIVRDKFYLNQQRHQEHPHLPSAHAPAAAAVDANARPSAQSGGRQQDVVDGALPNDSKHSPHSPPAAEERITPNAASKMEATAPPPQPHPRENGKAGGDGVGCSPDGVKVEMGAEEGGVKEAGSDNVEGEHPDKDRGKRRPNKCCVVM